MRILGDLSFWQLSLVLSVFSAACGSSPQAPIPDPGGPFQTTVPATAAINALTDSELRQLCNDFVAADRAFLTTAVSRDNDCLLLAIEAANRALIPAGDGGINDGGSDGGINDGGSDGGTATFQSVCQSAYDTCEQHLLGEPQAVTCPLYYANCSATVELFSACLNEIAAGEPVSLCVQSPTCDLATREDELNLKPLPKASDLPPLPACTRLHEDCPMVVLWYPCGTS